MSFLDKLLNGQINKEAEVLQGKDIKDHFDRKVTSHPWVESILELDPVQVEKEFLDVQAAEARALGKTAAHEFKSDEEVIESDYSRQVKAYSDYNLTELLALARAYKDNVSMEKFSEYKEDAKKNVASSREKCEKELIDLTGTHTLLDWKKAFDTFTKDAKVEQPTEKEIFEPKAPEEAHNFEKPTEEKFKVPSDEKKADVMIGVGREADERTEATKEAGVLQADITEGLGKVASVISVTASGNISLIKKAEYQGWRNSETWQVALWLDNDSNLNAMSAELAQTIPDQNQLAEELKNLVEEAKPNLGASLWDDMINWALAEVDWMEIANHFSSKFTEASKLPKVEKKAEVTPSGLKNKLMEMGYSEDSANAISAQWQAGQTVGTEPKTKLDVDKALAELSKSSAMNPLKREELPSQGCPVCGSMGKNLQNGEKDNMSCEGCGIKYACASLDTEGGAHEAWDVFLNGKEIDTIFYTADPKRTAEDVKRDLVNHDGYDANIMVKKGSQEIKSCASKKEVIEKIAELNKVSEIQSPWSVEKLADGTEAIVRREIVSNEEKDLNKESDEHKDEEIQK